MRLLLELEKLLVKNISKIKKKMAKKSYSKKDSNLFRIADLVVFRKRKEAWLLYQKELFNRTLAEDIFWKLFWQFKTLLFVSKGEKASLHPFVYSKAKKAVILFNNGEVEKKLSELLDLHHATRAGLCDLSIGLEKFILKI